MPSFSKRLRKGPGRVFNRMRNSSGGGDGSDSHNNNYSSNKVVSFLRMLVTRDKDVPDVATAWVASEEEILSEQGTDSAGENSAVVLP